MSVRRTITRAVCALVVAVVPAAAAVPAAIGASAEPAASRPSPAQTKAATAAGATAATRVEHLGAATATAVDELDAVVTLRSAGGDPTRSASPHDVATVTGWATAHGLTVRNVGPFHVLLSGPRATIAAAFGVRLAAARSPLDPAVGAAYVAPASAPRVPAALAAVAQAVLGLDNRPVSRPAVGFGPVRLRSIGSQPVRLAAGAGITVGTVQFSGWTPSQALTYANQNGIPLRNGQITTVAVDGAAPFTPQAGGDVEVALDVEALLATAPAARQRVYVAPNSVAGLVDVYAAMAADARAGKLQVTSSSWGGCEWGLDDGSQTYALAAQIRPYLAALVASNAKATFFAATGDSGSDGCANLRGQLNPPVDGVWFPASAPESVAVGGTNHNPSTDVETAWAGSGGGQSLVYAKPSYQAGVSVSGTTRRLVPDIASLADPATGAAIVDVNGQDVVGGTSLAAPLSAGSLATALSAAGRTQGLGDIHALLYANTGDFTDVTGGSSNGTYSPAAGFDAVTGLGVPRWNVLAPDLGLTAQVLTSYHPVNPARVLDTRTGLGIGGTARKLGQGGTIVLTVKGVGGLPSTGVAAVVLNVTATNPTAATNLAVYPTGSADGPTTSALNLVAGATAPNLVTTKVAADGTVTIRNNAGTVNVIADVQGWYARDSGLGYTPVTPVRVLDTRTGFGVGTGIAALPAHGSLVLQLAGQNGVPATGVQAVVLNVTATRPTRASFVSVYPTGFAGGTGSSNLNVVGGQTAANLVVTKLASDGTVTITNDAGTVDVIADLQGWYDTGGLKYLPLDPGRVLDTRIALGGPKAPLAAGVNRAFRVSEASVNVGAAVVNLTGVLPSAGTYLRIWPSDAALPATSSLNLDAHVTRANLTDTRVPTAGTLLARNNGGLVDVIADVNGYFGTQSG